MILDQPEVQPEVQLQVDLNMLVHLFSRAAGQRLGQGAVGKFRFIILDQILDNPFLISISSLVISRLRQSRNIHFRL